MREVVTEIEIDAPPATVWKTIADTASWTSWNPVVTDMKTDLIVGHPVRFKITVDGRTIPIVAKLVRVDVDQELCWGGPPSKLIGHVFRGEHYLRLFPSGENGTRFVHGERFGGALLPLLWWRLEGSLQRAYGEMNRALKRRVESA